MAKIKFGMMMTDARGKLGGQVFSKNRSGAYVRTKVTPVNAQTSYQQLVRFVLGSLSAGWSGLSDSARKAWDSAVRDWERSDVFGDNRTPTGKNLYTGLNQNLQLAGLSLVALPPEKVEMPVVEFLKADFNTDTSKLLASTRGDSTGFSFQIWATPPMSQGTNFVKNKLRYIGVATGGDQEVLDITTMYSDRFGSLPVDGQNIVVAVRLLASNGQVSPQLQQKVSYITD